MNPLMEIILNEIVKPEVNAANKTYLGTIESYNRDSRTVNVAYNNIWADKPDIIERASNVPIAHNAFLSFGSAPQPGYAAVIQFVGGDLQNPVVISITKDSGFDDSTGQSYTVPSVVSQTTDTHSTTAGLIPGAALIGFNILKNKFTELFK